MYYYVINPTAGRGSINTLQDKLRVRLSQMGIDGEFAKTTGPGDATKMVKSAIERGYNTIVAVGGDGTVNEVINGITKDSVAVGIIPIGRSNMIAHSLGVTTWQQACEVLAARRVTNYGLIAAGQKYFLSTLSLGLESPPQEEVDMEVPSHAPVSCRLTVDDKYELESPLVSLEVSNQKFSNPLAENKLAVSITAKPSKTRITSYVSSLLGRGRRQPEITTTQIKANRVLVETSRPASVMIDGKVSGQTPTAIRLTDRRIRFITEKQT